MSVQINSSERIMGDPRGGVPHSVSLSLLTSLACAHELQRSSVCVCFFTEFGAAVGQRGDWRAGGACGLGEH